MSSSVSPFREFFCQMPLGKPDTWFPLVEGVPRPRVFQKGQTHRSCAYRAMKMIRATFGKNATGPQLESRRFELLISQRRKERSAYIYKETGILNAIKRVFLKVQHIEGYKAAVEENGLFSKIFISIFLSLIENQDAQTDLLKSFLEQDEYSELGPYLKAKDLEADVEIDLRFLRAVYDGAGSVEEEVFNWWDSRNQTVKKEYQSFEDFPISLKRATTFGYTLKKSYELYGLQASSWTRMKPIEDLIEELSLKGPLAVFGTIGSIFYKEDVIPLEETRDFGGRSIYAVARDKVKPNFDELEGVKTLIGHSVVVIGAVKEGDSEFVYYLDPDDPSDPDDPNSQKVYKISYADFIKDICPIFGGSLIPRDEEIYALHGDNKGRFL